jgi:hypothetical protein
MGVSLPLTLPLTRQGPKLASLTVFISTGGNDNFN